MVSDSPLAKQVAPSKPQLSYLCIGMARESYCKGFVRSSVFVEQRSLQVQLEWGNLRAFEAPFPMDAHL